MYISNFLGAPLGERAFLHLAAVAITEKKLGRPVAAGEVERLDKDSTRWGIGVAMASQRKHGHVDVTADVGVCNDQLIAVRLYHVTDKGLDALKKTAACARRATKLIRDYCDAVEAI